MLEYACVKFHNTQYLLYVQPGLPPKNSTFSTQSVFMCFLYASRKKQGVLVCTELSDWSLNRTSFFRVCVTN